MSPASEFDAFVAGHPELLDKDLPLRHYSRERLWSQEARERFVDPDLWPFPREGSAAGGGGPQASGTGAGRLVP